MASPFIPPVQQSTNGQSPPTSTDFHASTSFISPPGSDTVFSNPSRRATLSLFRLRRNEQSPQVTSTDFVVNPSIFKSVSVGRTDDCIRNGKMYDEEKQFLREELSSHEISNARTTSGSILEKSVTRKTLQFPGSSLQEGGKGLSSPTTSHVTCKTRGQMSHSARQQSGCAGARSRAEIESAFERLACRTRPCAQEVGHSPGQSGLVPPAMSGQPGGTSHFPTNSTGQRAKVSTQQTKDCGKIDLVSSRGTFCKPHQGNPSEQQHRFSSSNHFSSEKLAGDDTEKVGGTGHVRQKQFSSILASRQSRLVPFPGRGERVIENHPPQEQGLPSKSQQTSSTDRIEQLSDPHKPLSSPDQWTASRLHSTPLSSPNAPTSRLDGDFLIHKNAFLNLTDFSASLQNRANYISNHSVVQPAGVNLHSKYEGLSSCQDPFTHNAVATKAEKEEAHVTRCEQTDTQRTTTEAGSSRQDCTMNNCKLDAEKCSHAESQKHSEERHSKAKDSFLFDNNSPTCGVRPGFTTVCTSPSPTLSFANSQPIPIISSDFQKNHKLLTPIRFASCVPFETGQSFPGTTPPIEHIKLVSSNVQEVKPKMTDKSETVPKPASMTSLESELRDYGENQRVQLTGTGNGGESYRSMVEGVFCIPEKHVSIKNDLIGLSRGMTKVPSYVETLHKPNGDEKLINGKEEEPEPNKVTIRQPEVEIPEPTVAIKPLLVVSPKVKGREGFEESEQKNSIKLIAKSIMEDNLQQEMLRSLNWKWQDSMCSTNFLKISKGNHPKDYQSLEFNHSENYQNSAAVQLKISEVLSSRGTENRKEEGRVSDMMLDGSDSGGNDISESSRKQKEGLEMVVETSRDVTEAQHAGIPKSTVCTNLPEVRQIHLEVGDAVDDKVGKVFENEHLDVCEQSSIFIKCTLAAINMPIGNPENRENDDDIEVVDMDTGDDSEDLGMMDGEAKRREAAMLSASGEKQDNENQDMLEEEDNRTAMVSEYRDSEGKECQDMLEEVEKETGMVSESWEKVGKGNQDMLDEEEKGTATVSEIREKEGKKIQGMIEFEAEEKPMVSENRGKENKGTAMVSESGSKQRELMGKREDGNVDVRLDSGGTIGVMMEKLGQFGNDSIPSEVGEVGVGERRDESMVFEKEDNIREFMVSKSNVDINWECNVNCEELLYPGTQYVDIISTGGENVIEDLRKDSEETKEDEEEEKREREREIETEREMEIESERERESENEKEKEKEKEREREDEKEKEKEKEKEREKEREIETEREREREWEREEERVREREKEKEKEKEVKREIETERERERELEREREREKDRERGRERKREKERVRKREREREKEEDSGSPGLQGSRKTEKLCDKKSRQTLSKARSLPPLPSPIVPLDEKRKSLESNGIKTSRSGRPLIPVLAFWRNQRVVSDKDRSTLGIFNGTPEATAKSSEMFNFRSQGNILSVRGTPEPLLQRFQEKTERNAKKVKYERKSEQKETQDDVNSEEEFESEKEDNDGGRGEGGGGEILGAKVLELEKEDNDGRRGEGGGGEILGEKGPSVKGVIAGNRECGKGEPEIVGKVESEMGGSEVAGERDQTGKVEITSLNLANSVKDDRSEDKDKDKRRKRKREEVELEGGNDEKKIYNKKVGKINLKANNCHMDRYGGQSVGEELEGEILKLEKKYNKKKGEGNPKKEKKVSGKTKIGGSHSTKREKKKSGREMRKREKRSNQLGSRYIEESGWTEEREEQLDDAIHQINTSTKREKRKKKKRERRDQEQGS